MNPFKYSDEQLSQREFMFAFPSVLIGVAILSLPSDVAKVTSFSDGWVSIFLAGIIFTLLTILGLKLAALFPGKSFLTYTSFLISRPVAITISIILILLAIFTTAYSLRSVSFISQQYLFDQTPMEVLALAFLLVVIYAVSGSRAGIFRLNVLFLPIILLAFIFVVFFNIKWFEVNNLLPLFKSDISEYLHGIKNTFGAYGGFYLVLFYFTFINNPTKITRKIVFGMSIPIIFYIMIFFACIAVFGNAVTGNLTFPTIELAKRVDIPGAVLERIDALVFTIWIMAIFNTTTITLDIAVLLLTSIYKKVKKRIVVFILSPIVYYLSMFPQQINQVEVAGNFINIFHIFFTSLIIIGLFVIAKWRGVKNQGEK